MMSALFMEEGASLRIDILAEKEITDFIDTHSKILDNSFSDVEMSDIMREQLQQSNWIFSGIKTFHELNEAFPSLLDEYGHKKPFDQFFTDVQKIDKTYNKNYLRAEYDFAHTSAQMASRWEEFQQNGDTYYLQYRTASDDKVRPEHAAMHGITLPPSDPFWDNYFPPNGWGCRCTVVEVLKKGNEQTPYKEAMDRGKVATQKDRRGMFKFNPGKLGKTFPNYNPYTISKCKNCDKNLSLAKSNELCLACIFLKTEVCGYVEVPTERGYVRQHRSQSPDEKLENRNIATYLANKYGYKIDLLPKVDDKPGRKNADSFNHTLGYPQEYKVNAKGTYNSIDMALKDGGKQASSIVLQVGGNINFTDLSRAIHSRVARSGRIKEITVICNGKDIQLKREQMVRNGFKIQMEDLK